MIGIEKEIIVTQSAISNGAAVLDVRRGAAPALPLLALPAKPSQDSHTLHKGAGIRSPPLLRTFSWLAVPVTIVN
jgi:hypothetical protein